MNRAPRPTVAKVDKSNITTFKSSDEIVFIAYIPDEEGHLKSTLIALAERHADKFMFGIASDPKVAITEHMQFPSIVCHKMSEGEQEVFSGQAGIDALEKFIGTATAPIIGEFTRRNEMKYMKVRASIEQRTQA